jgi:predicted Zn-dependent protease
MRYVAIGLKCKIAAATAAATPQFLSTHRSSATRIRDLEARLPTVVPLYEAARH